MLRNLLLALILLVISCRRTSDEALDALQRAVLSSNPSYYIETNQNYIRTLYTLEELRKADSSKVVYRTKVGNSIHIFYIEAYRNEHPDTFIIYLTKAGKEYRIINGSIRGLEVK